MKTLIGFLMLMASTTLHANAGLRVEKAWVRATVTGQMATGAFMRITAPSESRLVGVRSTVAIAQVHQMTMDQGVMRMSAVPGGLRLPAGQAVELKPGGYHIMLLDLKTSLQPGQKLALTLVYQNAQGKESTQALELPVLSQAPSGSTGANAPHGHKNH